MLRRIFICKVAVNRNNWLFNYLSGETVPFIMSEYYNYKSLSLAIN